LKNFKEGKDESEIIQASVSDKRPSIKDYVFKEEGVS